MCIRDRSGGGRAVLLLNRGTQPLQIAVDWAQLDYPADLQAEVRDLWQHKQLAPQRGRYAAEVPGHGVFVVKVQP